MEKKRKNDPSSPANEEDDVKASDAKTAAEREAGEGEADDVEEDETKELLRNGEAEAPTGVALPVWATPPIAVAEILPERKERDAIGEASASAMVRTRLCCGLATPRRFVSFILSTNPRRMRQALRASILDPFTMGPVANASFSFLFSFGVNSFSCCSSLAIWDRLCLVREIF